MVLLMLQRTRHEGDDGDGASRRCKMDNEKDVAEEE